MKSPPAFSLTFLRRHAQSRTVKIWAFPSAIIYVFLFFISGGISGSSVGSLEPGPIKNLIFGLPQAIRNDEFNIATPMYVHQSHYGFPQVMNSGFGNHNIALTFNLPIRGWITLFRPWEIPSLFFNLKIGFSADWWIPAALMILGVYFLLLELTRRVDIAIVVSLALFLSPFFQWWFEVSTLSTVGTGCFTLFFLLRALSSKLKRSSIIYSLLSASSLVSFLLILYPPFEIPVGLTLIVIGSSEFYIRFKESKITKRALFISLGTLILLGLVALVAFYFQYHRVISEIASSVYPGRRRSVGGSPSLVQFFSAPLNLNFLKNGNSLLTTNQCEMSSFILLGPFIFMQMFYVGIKHLEWQAKVRISACMAIFMVLTAWYLFGLPEFISKILFLDFVPTNRSIIGVGFSSFMLLATFLSSTHDDSIISIDNNSLLQKDLFCNKRRMINGSLLLGTLSFTMYLVSGEMIRNIYPTLRINFYNIVFCSLLVSLSIGFLLARKIFIGGLLLVSFSLLTAGFVNPLYVGLTPLTSSNYLNEITKINSASASALRNFPNWVAFEGAMLSAPLVASGVPTINIAQPYADKKLWRSLPLMMNKDNIWNRFATFYFLPGPSGSRASVSLHTVGGILIQADPCGEFFNSLKVGYFISEYPISGRCLSLRNTINYGDYTLSFYSRRLTANPN